MKNISVILLITLALCYSANSQTKSKQNRQTLPANINKNVGDYPTELLKNPIIKSRMKKLLGKSYTSFFDSFETQSQFVKKGNFLFSNGCLIHACGHLESAIAIDLVNKTIHAAIYRQDEKTKYFNENNRKTPKVMQNWANRLTADK